MTGIYMKDPYLPVDMSLLPSWWNGNYGLTFERDYYYEPKRRVSQEQQMRHLLYERFGDLGIGQKNAPRRPIVGPQLVGGCYLTQEILGCEIVYNEKAPPWVEPRNLSEKEAWALQVPEDFDNNPAMRNVLNLLDALEDEFGYLQGDVPLHGIANIAIDLRGHEYFIDLVERQDLADHMHTVISKTIYEQAKRLKARTGSCSMCINRVISHFSPSTFMSPNCSLQMISPKMYEKQILKHDMWLTERLQPAGFHHCGNNAHLFAPLYALTGATFLDIGYGSDIASCRKALPEAWLSLRMDPRKMQWGTPEETEVEVKKLLDAHGSPWNKVAVWCSSLDYGTPDESIRAMFKTVAEYRGNRYSDLSRAYMIS